MTIDILGHDNYALAVQIDLIRDLYEPLPSINIVKNIDDEKNVNREYPFSLKEDPIQIIHFSGWKTFTKSLVLGAMAAKTKQTIHQFFHNKFDFSDSQFINLIHPLAYLAPSATLGRGIVLEPTTAVSSFAELDDFVWVKRMASVGHHTKVGKYTNINPGATISSGCTIGEKALIGVGAIIRDKVTIGTNSIIGAGAVVLKDIPDNVIAFGNPAKVVRENDIY